MPSRINSKRREKLGTAFVAIGYQVLKMMCVEARYRHFRPSIPIKTDWLEPVLGNQEELQAWKTSALVNVSKKETAAPCLRL